MITSPTESSLPAHLQLNGPLAAGCPAQTKRSARSSADVTPIRGVTRISAGFSPVRGSPSQSLRPPVKSC